MFKTKHSGISFFNEEAEACLIQYEKSHKNKQGKLFVIGHETFLKAWNRARRKSGLCLKPKDSRDFFSREMGKAFVPDRYIDIFQGKAPKYVLAKHHNPHGIGVLKAIYEKANLKILE